MSLRQKSPQHLQGGGPVSPRGSWFRAGRSGVLGAAITLAWLLALTGAEKPIATVRAAQAGDGVPVLFAEMMPVFTSPRCLGCHGQVNPSEGTNHEGGKVDVATDDRGDMAKDTKEAKACLECHTAANQWRTAPAALSFVGKDTGALCAQIKRLNKLRGTNTPAQRAFLAHLSTDYFVGLAFVGLRAVGKDSPFGPLTPDPPPMSRAEFVAAGKRWIQEGRASCGSLWNGTITKSTEWRMPSTITQGGTVRTQASRDSELTITVTDGLATAEAGYQEYSETDDPRSSGGSCSHRLSNEGARTTVPVPATALVDVLEGRGSIVFSANAMMEGERTTQITTFPACKTVKVDTDFMAGIQGGYADGPVDPKDSTHVAGEKAVTEVDGTKTVIKWDLKLTDD